MKRAVKVVKRMADWRWGERREGLISRVTKDVLERDKASKER